MLTRLHYDLPLELLSSNCLANASLTYVWLLPFWEEPSLSPGVLKKTLSHIWFKLYLPMFWFNVGLFTLKKIDSLMVLAYPQSSLPIMLKLSSVMPWPDCWICQWMGEGCLRCSFLFLLSFFSKSPGGFPYIFFITVKVVALIAVNYSTFVVLGVLVLGFH